MTYEVTALSKSIMVLKCIAQSEQPLGVSEIVRRTQISKNMVFRICQTLCAESWLEVIEPGPRYRLTLTPYRLFAQPLEATNISDVGKEFVQELQRQSNETAYLSVLDQNRAVNIYVREGNNSLRVAGGLGSSYDLHCCAQGKIFLAHYPFLIKDISLKKYTDNTITSKKQLRQETEHIKQEGYAVNNEEYGRGLLGCAAPVFDQYQDCVAALGIFAASTNVTMQDMLDRCVPMLKQAAASMSTSLGA